MSSKLVVYLFGLMFLTALGGSCTAAGSREAKARLWWRGVESFEAAKAEEAMQASLRKPGRIGDRAMDAVFLHPQSTGLARLTYPHVSFRLKRERAFFLCHAGIAEGFDWQDKEHTPDGVRFHVKWQDREVASTYLRESKWVPLVAPLLGPPVGAMHWQAEVQAPLTLATDSGPAHNANYDWAMFGEPIIVSVSAQPLAEVEPVAGTTGVVIAQLQGGHGRLVVQGLDATGKPIHDAISYEEVPTGTRWTFVRFDFSAQPACTQWQWKAEGIQVAQVWGGSLQPRIVLERFGPTSAVVARGEALHLRATVRNGGLGAVLPANEVTLVCRDQVKHLERLAPGARATVDFALGQVPPRPTAFSVEARAKGEKLSAITALSPAPWHSLPKLPAHRPNMAEFRELGKDYVVLENPQSRWLINRTVPGLGALVWVWIGDGWELAGSVAPLVELAPGGGLWRRPRVSRVKLSAFKGGARLEAEGTEGDFRVSLKLELWHTARALRVETKATALRDSALSGLRGPAVHAGDRAGGVKKGIAVFPGLEYLDDGERSSSQRDLAPPLNERWTPHKFKVTVPMMVVETRRGGPVLGVAWDPRQKWDGEHLAPTARFASPDFLDGQNNHLMQLMAPSVPDFMEENRDRAAKPVAVKEGQQWTLDQQIIAARPQPEATEVFEWFDDLVGYPPPEQWPRSFEEEIALCRHGFMVTLWDPEKQGNRHCVGWGPGNTPGAATLLLMDARALARGATRQQLLDRVRLIARKTVQEEGDAGLASRRNCHTMMWEFPYHAPPLDHPAQHLLGALEGMKREAYQALGSQEEDGGWGYYPDKRRSVLGKSGTRVIGIAARNTLALAKWVAISGDPKAEAGLRRALVHMQRYRVPRGAQGWECPILEPDVLAAAYAVRAYVWAYIALGDPAYLDRARYWARTGLPFQYAWDDGQHPGMRYASIPVFGSTFFHHSWIGLPVQWCGLVYAYGLQELMRFDDNKLWRKQAEGILASAVHQQWPMDNEKLAGSYPDSFGNWFTRRNGAYINPENIMLNALALRGLDPGLRSVRAELGGHVVHVTAPADLHVRPQGHGLAIELKYLPGQMVCMTVAPVRPAGGRGQVEVTGAEESAYSAARATLAVAVRCDHQGRGHVKVEGLEYAPPQELGPRNSWDFNRDTEGWDAAHACGVAAAGGKLVITVQGKDPYAVSGPVALDAGKYKKLRMRVRVSAGREIGLFWRSSVSTNWGPDKERHVQVRPGKQWQEIVFDLSDHKLWAGKILQIRLDLEPAEVPVGSKLEVDWIRPE